MKIATHLVAFFVICIAICNAKSDSNLVAIIGSVQQIIYIRVKKIGQYYQRFGGGNSLTIFVF